MFQITLPDDLSQLHELAERLGQYSDRVGLSEETQMRLDLVVEELFVNFVRHGLAGNGRFRLSVDCDESCLHLTLEDNGQPFNPLEAAVPDTTAPLENRQVGQLGLHLVREMTSERSYERASGWNVIRLAMPRTGVG